MKKFLLFALIVGAATTANAQGQASVQPQGKEAVKPQQGSTANTPSQADMATMLKQAIEKQVPPMVEKTGLTTAQATRIIEINFEIRQAAVGLRDLSDADRSAKIAELKAAKEKKYSEIPLSADQIKAVYAYYEDMGKNMEQKKN